MADHLRARHPEPDSQQRLTRALLSSVLATATGQPAWETAHPYLRSHLASHAAAAGQLGELLSDPGFLLAADPDRLLGVLPAVSDVDGQQAADVYRTVLYQLRGRPLPEAAAYLQLAARQHGADQLAERVDRLNLDRPWSVPWAFYPRVHSHLILGTHTRTVSALAVTQLDGRPIAITGGHDATIRVWDLARGTQLQELGGHTHGVSALVVAQLDGQPIAIAASGNAVRVWDLGRGIQLHQLTGHRFGVTALAVTQLDGRPIAITGSRDATVRVWDPAQGNQLLNVSLDASVEGLTPSPRNLLIVQTSTGLIALRLHL